MVVRFRAVVGSSVLMCWLAACAATGGNAASGDQQALQAAHEQRQRLLAELRAMDSAQATCKVSDGDCLLIVSEKREVLFEPQPECQGHSDVYEREACHANLLAKAGKVEEVTEFLEYENWCLAKVVDCTDEVQEQKSEAERVAQLQARRQALLSATNVEQLGLQIAYARERVIYLRATVPKDRDNACADLAEVQNCRERAQQETSELELELAKDAAEYDEERAAQLFQSEMTTQTECFESEYSCLTRVVANYGANRESKLHLQRNLKLLKQRQELVAKLPQPVTQECLATADADYGPRIEKSYQRYVKQPNTLFRVFLHQSYVKLHSAQLKCLKRHSG